MILDSSSVLWMHEIEDVIADEGDGIVTVFADRFADEDDVALSIEPVDDVWHMIDDVATDLFERSQHPLNTKLGLWSVNDPRGDPGTSEGKDPIGSGGRFVVMAGCRRVRQASATAPVGIRLPHGLAVAQKYKNPLNPKRNLFGPIQGPFPGRQPSSPPRLRCRPRAYRPGNSPAAVGRCSASRHLDRPSRANSGRDGYRLAAVP